jgi:hypothetical protein
MLVCLNALEQGADETGMLTDNGYSHVSPHLPASRGSAEA